MTSFETTNSVFNITIENSFSITTPGHWNSDHGNEIINKLNKSLELRSQNDIGLYIQKLRKKGNQLKYRGDEYKLSDLETHKTEIVKELKNLDFNGFEDMVYRMLLTYNEIVDIMDVQIMLDQLMVILIL